MMETLNELAHLRDAGFGRPWPRHGLKLLYWFANKCVSIGNDNVMLSECEPADGDFGFHCFENRYDDYGNKLLPDVNIPYYVVGNLNTRKYPGAEELPEYVSEDTYTDQLNSNTDRIIVSLYDEERFHRVYVTQHNDRSNYDPDATYRISRGLLMIIRRMNLQNFLEKMEYYTYIQPLINYRPQTTNTVSSSSSDSDDSEPPETQRNYSTTQIDDNKKKTGYYTYKQPVLPTPVINYRPQTTSTLSSDFTAVTSSSSEPAHNKPPAAQNNDTIIQFDDNEKTGYYTYKQPVTPTPVSNYRPQTPNTVSPEFTAVTPSSSEPAHNKPPETQRKDTIIQFDDDTPSLNSSENLHIKKGFWESICTIL